MAFKKFFKKIAAALAAGAMMVAMAVPAMAADTEVWSGDAWTIKNWDNEFKMEADALPVQFKAGDVITVSVDSTVTVDGEDWHQIKVQNDGNGGNALGDDVDCVDIAGKTEFKFTLTEDYAKAINENGLAINGHAFAITKITVSSEAAAADTATAAAADSKTGDSANVGLILAIAAAVVAVGATVVIKKREAVER